MATPEGSSSSRSPYLWWGISAIFVAGVIIALVIVLTFGRGTPQADPPPTTSSSSDAPPASTPAPSASTATKGSCNLAAGNQEVPTDAPPAEWSVNDYGVLVPSSSALGPSSESDGIPTCFSQDPGGALIAATHMFATLSQQQDNLLRLRTVQARVLDGPAKEEAVASVKGSTLNPSASLAQVAGFRFVQYTNTDAYVTLAATVQGQQNIAILTYHLVWENGDWYFSGEDFTTGTGGPSSQLSEFTRWGQR